METLTPKNLDVLRKEIVEALAPITAKHNVSFNIGKMSYDSESMDFKVSANVVPEGVDPEYANDYRSLERYGHYYGLSTDDFQKKFKVPRRGGFDEATIIGVNPKAPKYCIITVVNGDRIRFGESVLKHYRKAVEEKG